MRNDTGHAPIGGRVLATHVDELMGVRLMLVDSAFQVEQEGTKGVLVPDLDDLRAAVAVARALVQDKLAGKEIRFLRKALHMKAAELARFLDVTAETMSRWENDREVININAERVFRFRVLTDLREKAPGVEVDLRMAVELKPSPFRASTMPTTLIFERVTRVVEGRREKMWLYQGVLDEKDAEFARENPVALRA